MFRDLDEMFSHFSQAEDFYKPSLFWVRDMGGLPDHYVLTDLYYCASPAP